MMRKDDSAKVAKKYGYPTEQAAACPSANGYDELDGHAGHRRRTSPRTADERRDGGENGDDFQLFRDAPGFQYTRSWSQSGIEDEENLQLICGGRCLDPMQRRTETTFLRDGDPRVKAETLPMYIQSK
ncbi:unnamed protein product [Heligmosomoides polygyrus]|uniref:Uncharacterized protein n=1 Tax=Heligmosomoides polygyrus TaxID=6339 RepID=A0A183FV43_HELPZ|nr:unnamed protein product [Heligmosomoides polygyrus]